MKKYWSTPFVGLLLLLFLFLPATVSAKAVGREPSATSVPGQEEFSGAAIVPATTTEKPLSTAGIVLWAVVALLLAGGMSYMAVNAVRYKRGEALRRQSQIRRPLLIISQAASGKKEKNDEKSRGSP